MAGNVTYAQLLETNNMLQHFTDETYFQCVMRTAQESKLFPISPYMMLNYLNAFYRYPTLLRKIEAQMPAEELGDRARAMGTKIDSLTMGWCIAGFYLLGREWLLNMGLLRPEDALEDVVQVMDFWKRMNLSYRRNSGHLTSVQFGHRTQLLPEYQLQIFEADMWPCSPGDRLHTAIAKFQATISQYQFLSHCECRIGICNQGPYRFGEDGEMIVRDFLDLAEGDYPWLDDIASEFPFNNITIPIATKGTHFYMMDEFGTFEAEPDLHADMITHVGLYTSDYLTEGWQPVAMESPEALAAMFEKLNDIASRAMAELWKRIAGWSRMEMIEAGAMVYYSIPKDLAHLAGVYEQSDWFDLDERAKRFIPLLNDEYSNNILGELVVLLTAPSQRMNDYTMMKFSNQPTRMMTHLPMGVLATGEYVPTVGPMYPGDHVLPDKKKKWRTSRGDLTQAEYNAAVRAFTPKLCSQPYRFLDETWVKYHYDDPQVDEMYRIAQESSRNLKGKGAGLRRADIWKLRGDG